MRKLYFYFCSLFCTYLSKTSNFFSINIRIQKYVFFVVFVYIFSCFFFANAMKLMVNPWNDLSHVHMHMDTFKNVTFHAQFRLSSTREPELLANSFFLFVSIQETRVYWLVPLVCLFVELYRQKQQRINSGGNQNNASFKHFTCVRINIRLFSRYAGEEMDDATKEITIINFNFQE